MTPNHDLPVTQAVAVRLVLLPLGLGRAATCPLSEEYGIVEGMEPLAFPPRVPEQRLVAPPHSKAPLVAARPSPTRSDPPLHPRNAFVCARVAINVVGSASTLMPFLDSHHHHNSLLDRPPPCPPEH
ncbi:hypothetical protein DFH09DRAFT_1302048 [Mycena vulgaris]|nr:hypothetical protein DFH09DRAFT_1302048 [Mycena vulgaris]